MTFIRFGALKPVKQRGLRKWLCGDFHKPPRKRGFYAMPYGNVDMDLVPDGWTDGDMRIQYLRGEGGRKLTGLDKDGNTPEFRAALKRAGVSAGDVKRRWPSSYVAVIQDVANPPRLDARGRLNQKVNYLLDNDGEKIDACLIFKDRDWWMSRDFFLDHPCSLEELEAEALCRCLSARDLPWDKFEAEARRLGYVYGQPLLNLAYCDRCLTAYDYCEMKWRKLLCRLLARRRLDVRQLFAWPVFENGNADELYYFKKPHLFEFSGCLWHHLGSSYGTREILQVEGAWVYTTMKTYEKVLKKNDRKKSYFSPEVFIEEDASAAPRRERS